MPIIRQKRRILEILLIDRTKISDIIRAIPTARLADMWTMYVGSEGDCCWLVSGLERGLMVV